MHILSGSEHTQQVWLRRKQNHLLQILHPGELAFPVSV